MCGDKVRGREIFGEWGAGKDGGGANNKPLRVTPPVRGIQVGCEQTLLLVYYTLISSLLFYSYVYSSSLIFYSSTPGPCPARAW